MDLSPPPVHYFLLITWTSQLNLTNRENLSSLVGDFKSMIQTGSMFVTGITERLIIIVSLGISKTRQVTIAFMVNVLHIPCSCQM